MRGAIAVSTDLDDIMITQGGELLSLYQFNTNTARHYFCSRCGIYTHHQRRSNPKEYGVNPVLTPPLCARCSVPRID
jgi:hypothetical protein